MRLDLNLETVKDFALDVWEDLGRTRLAGVAVGLSVALLMITTAVLLRPGGETDVEASSPVIAPTTPEEDVSFTAPDDEPMELADIDLSAPRDPFRSLDGLAASDQTLLPAGEQILETQMPCEEELARPQPPAIRERLDRVLIALHPTRLAYQNETKIFG